LAFDLKEELYISFHVQTVTSILTYFDEPRTTSTYYKPAEPSDAPWITICPVPGVSFSNWERIVRSGGVQHLDFTAYDAITTNDFENTMQKGKVNLSQFLSQTAMPIWPIGSPIQSESESGCYYDPVTQESFCEIRQECKFLFKIC
jgi:hypothetical protein